MYAQSHLSLTGKPTTIGGYGITDPNRNQCTLESKLIPTAGFVLSWNGTDYAWVDNAGYSNPRC